MVFHSPVLEYITAMGKLQRLGPYYNLPGSVTTLGLCFNSRVLDSWIGNRVHIPSLKRLVVMNSESPVTFSSFAKQVNTIDLRPDPLTDEDELTRGPKEDFGIYLARLPSGDARGTLVYSGIFYTPPPTLYDQYGQLLQYEWVSAITLKTSGSSRMTERERWNALVHHLDFIPHSFPNLESVDLCDDFHNWKNRPELLVFEVLVKKRGIALRYVL